MEMQETEAPEDTPAGLASGRYRSKYAMIATAIVTAHTVIMTFGGEQSRKRKRIGLPPFFYIPLSCQGAWRGSRPSKLFTAALLRLAGGLRRVPEHRPRYVRV